MDRQTEEQGDSYISLKTLFAGVKLWMYYVSEYSYKHLSVNLRLDNVVVVFRYHRQEEEIQGYK